MKTTPIITSVRIFRNAHNNLPKVITKQYTAIKQTNYQMNGQERAFKRPQFGNEGLSEKYLEFSPIGEHGNIQVQQPI